jgi:LysM repeat protein
MLLASIVAGAVLMLGSLAAVASGTLSHTIVYGDTLSELAQRFGTDVDALAELNAIENPDLIIAGEKLLIPSSAAGSGNEAASEQPVGVGASANASTLSYTVQEGDTLTSIAERFGVTVDELAELNGIENVDLIVTGEDLLVTEASAEWAGGSEAATDDAVTEENTPVDSEEAADDAEATDGDAAVTEGDAVEEAEGSDATSEEEEAAAATDETADSAAATDDGPAETEADETAAEDVSTSTPGTVVDPLQYELHLVLPGETLASVAEQYGVTEAQLSAANWHSRNGITLGMILKVPPSEMGGVRLLGVPSALEEWPVASEVAAAALATTYWGSAVAFDELLAAIPVADNPHEGFRGAYTGMWGSTDDYGVYSGPLATALQSFGLAADAFYADGDAAALTSRIDSGAPVLVWITFQLTPQERNVVENEGGRYSLIAEQHAVLVYGYDDAGVMIVDVSDGLYHHYAWDDFMTSWNLFDGMGLAITPAE